MRRAQSIVTNLRSAEGYGHDVRDTISLMFQLRHSRDPSVLPHVQALDQAAASFARRAFHFANLYLAQETIQ